MGTAAHRTLFAPRVRAPETTPGTRFDPAVAACYNGAVERTEASKWAGPQEPGECPSCRGTAEWLPVDETRRGRICRACGWVELPQPTIQRHTVGSLLRRMFPNSRLIPMIDYLRALRQTRRNRNGV